MSAGKINSRIRSRKPTAVIALFAMFAIAARSHQAYAACGPPSTIELSGGAVPAEAGAASSQNGPPKIIPSGPNEPIVGLWEITVSFGTQVVDNVFTGWTSDGLEFDQDTGSPILTGYVCYGQWVKLKGSRTYGLTHPYFSYDPVTGLWNGTSGYFNYTVTVSKDGKTFTGKENGLGPVTGANPYTGTGGTPFSGLTLSATKIAVDTSLLP